MFDWDDFKDLDTTTVISVDLNEQLLAVLSSAMSLLESEDFANDIPDDRDAVFSEVNHALSQP